MPTTIKTPERRDRLVVALLALDFELQGFSQDELRRVASAMAEAGDLEGFVRRFRTDRGFAERVRRAGL